MRLLEEPPVWRDLESVGAWIQGLSCSLDFVVEGGGLVCFTSDFSPPPSCFDEGMDAPEREEEPDAGARGRLLRGQQAYKAGRSLCHCVACS